MDIKLYIKKNFFIKTTGLLTNNINEYLKGKSEKLLFKRSRKA